MKFIYKFVMIVIMAHLVLFANPCDYTRPISTDTQSGIVKSTFNIHRAIRFFGAQSARAASTKRAIWTSEEITNSNSISVDGQYALFRMCSYGGVDQIKNATSILTAIIDDGTLAGIYQVDFKVPAFRARDHLGKGWWDLIPKGEDSTCVEGIKNGKGKNAPMIVYRKDIGSHKGRVERALQDAWDMCREVYKLPEYEPIPCVIAKRPPLILKNCSPAKNKMIDKMYDDCVNQNPINRENWLTCTKKRKHCNGLDTEKWKACASKVPECAEEFNMANMCWEYVEKHITCP